jgi:hypothetical protein
MQKVFAPLVSRIWSLETITSRFLVVREAITSIVFGRLWFDGLPEMTSFPTSIKLRHLGDALWIVEGLVQFPISPVALAL